MHEHILFAKEEMAYCQACDYAIKINDLIAQVEKAKKKYRSGQNIFRRGTVTSLLERISQLENALKGVSNVTYC